MNLDTLNDEHWLAYILAEAEPFEDKPEVRGIVFDRYVDALRVLRILNARDSDGKPVLHLIERIPIDGGGFFMGSTGLANIGIT